MKARMLPGQKLSRQEKESVNRYIRKQISIEREQQSKTFANRMMKIIFVALNRKFGFGKERLQRVYQAVDELLAEAMNDELYWWHIDQIIYNEIGLDFHQENPENYEHFEKNHGKIAKDIAFAVHKTEKEREKI